MSAERHCELQLVCTKQSEKWRLSHRMFPRTTTNRLMLGSIIKTKQINSFDKRRFIKFIGICENHIFNELQDNINEYLK